MTININNNIKYANIIYNYTHPARGLVEDFDYFFNKYRLDRSFEELDYFFNKYRLDQSFNK